MLIILLYIIVILYTLKGNRNAKSLVKVQIWVKYSAGCTNPLHVFI